MSYEIISDDDIVSLLLEKSDESKRKAFNLIYDKYLNFVYDFGRTMGIPKDHCDDFVQEVFFRLFRKIHKFNTRKRFFPWFYSLVRNCCYDYVKYLGKHKDTDYRIENYVYNPYEFEIETINYVRDIISRLPNDEREVIFLRFYQDLSVDEITQVLGYSTRKVYNIIDKALKEIERHWSGK